MAQTLLHAIAEEVADETPAVYHYVCCRDDERALCGTHVQGSWGDLEHVPFCIECYRKDKKQRCPLYGVCADVK